MNERICTKCGGNGPFYADKRTKTDGLSAKCKQCHLALGKKYYSLNKDKFTAANKVWAAAHPERMHLFKSEWAARNPDKVAKKNAEYVRNNREKVLTAKLAWQKKNPEKTNVASRRHQAAKRGRKILWADQRIIKNLYQIAAAIGWHVDHEIPLQGRLVCGLHTHTNLRVIRPLENRRKGNSFEIMQETVL